MRNEIQRFMQECPAAKQQSFANNAYGNFVRAALPEAIYETGLVDREKYLITASVGAGNWAMIPWICIFDKSITTSATKGVYIVYLLSKDSKRLYLTFNQGCTELRQQHSKRETIEFMHQIATEIRSKVDRRHFISGDDIDLGEGLTELGIFYKEGTIFYTCYDVDAIPEEAVLRNDVAKMMDIYRDYVRSLQQDQRIGHFDSWEIVNENTAIKTCDKSFYDYNGSGVPKGICWFFEAENLDLGATIPLTFQYQGNTYAGNIRNESSDRRRVRIFWNAELGALLKAYQGDPEAKATFRRKGKNLFEITMMGSQENEVVEDEMMMREKIDQIKAYIAASGFSYDDGLIENFYLSLKSKPFVILAGTSGTGKTRLGKLFAEAIGAEYKAVAVRPDWSDSTDLFGHLDLNGKFIPGTILDFIAEAQRHPQKPYILCLDEMNLARVEYYLSDFLSVIETRTKGDNGIQTEPLLPLSAYGSDHDAAAKYGTIRFPENLYIVGTVNMDETTFPFSRKVLDRANTIEFNYVKLAPTWTEAEKPAPISVSNDFLRSRYLLLQECPEETHEDIDVICERLERINEILRKANAHVGYRVRDEIVFYLLNNQEAELLTEDAAMDNEIMQKILPRIQGSNGTIKEMLCDLFKELAGDYEGYQTESNDTGARMLDMLRKNEHVRYSKSAEKIAFMVRRFEEDGFTSYWL